MKLTVVSNCSWEPHSFSCIVALWGPELVPGYFVQKTGLQDVVWGLWGCFGEIVFAFQCHPESFNLLSTCEQAVID